MAVPKCPPSFLLSLFLAPAPRISQCRLAPRHRANHHLRTPPPRVSLSQPGATHLRHLSGLDIILEKQFTTLSTVTPRLYSLRNSEGYRIFHHERKSEKIFRSLDDTSQFDHYRTYALKFAIHASRLVNWHLKRVKLCFLFSCCRLRHRS